MAARLPSWRPTTQKGETITSAFTAGDRVRVRHTAAGLIDGTVWSYGPDDQTYWVIPDQPQPDMIQGCIKASLQLMEEIADATLW